VRKLLPTPIKGDLPFPQNPNEAIKKGAEFMPTLEDFGFSKEEISNHEYDKRACY
jgi:hypothetical protein